MPPCERVSEVSKRLGEIRNCHINVGTGKELTIRELSELVVKAVGFEDTVEFDASKPNGTIRELIRYVEFKENPVPFDIKTE